MHFEMKRELWISASQCAKRLGLTVRALRVYEEYGLVRPRRTEKNWRVYGLEEVARLNEILALKRLGLGLSQIGKILTGKSTDLQELLDIQRFSLSETRKQADKSLVMIDSLRAKINNRMSLSVDDLLELARDTHNGSGIEASSMWKRYEQSRPRTEVPLDPATFSDYAGFYRNFDDLVLSVFVRNGMLFIQLTGSPELPMFPESVDKFFAKNLPFQITFSRLPNDDISEVTVHSSGHEWRLPKVDEAYLKETERHIAWRAENRIPIENSAVLVEGLIISCQQGFLDHDRFHPALIASLIVYFDALHANLKAFGSVKKVDFKGVSSNGLDIYDASFEHGCMECGIRIGQDGRFVNIHFRPIM